MTDNAPGQKYWWADDEEGAYQGPFYTEEDCHSDAYRYRAKCFDDPSQYDGLFIAQGADLVDCEIKYITGLEITDKFHDAWKALQARHDELVRVVEGMEGALKLYADPTIYLDDYGYGNPLGRRATDALAALAAWKEKQ